MYSWVDLISCIQNMRPHTDRVCVLVFAPVSRNHNFDIPVRIVTRFACAEGSSKKFQQFLEHYLWDSIKFYSDKSAGAFRYTHTVYCVCVWFNLSH